MTPPVKPARRRAANLVTTFTPDEVRALDLVLTVLLPDHSFDLKKHDVKLRTDLESAAAKFTRLRNKARSGS